MAIPGDPRQWLDDDGQLLGMCFPDSWALPEAGGAEAAARAFLVRHAPSLGLTAGELQPLGLAGARYLLELYRSVGTVIVIGLVRTKDALPIAGQGVTVHVRKRDGTVIAAMSTVKRRVLLLLNVRIRRWRVPRPGQLRALLGLRGRGHPWDGDGLTISGAKAHWARTCFDIQHQSSGPRPWTGSPPDPDPTFVPVLDIDFRVSLKGRKREAWRARVDLAGTVVYDLQALSAGVTGVVFKMDPRTRGGGSAPDPTGTEARSSSRRTVSSSTACCQRERSASS